MANRGEELRRNREIQRARKAGKKPPKKKKQQSSSRSEQRREGARRAQESTRQTVSNVRNTYESRRDNNANRGRATSSGTQNHRGGVGSQAKVTSSSTQKQSSGVGSQARTTRSGAITTAAQKRAASKQVSSNFQANNAEWKKTQIERQKLAGKTTATGGTVKTHTGKWGNPVGKAITDVAADVSTRTRYNTTVLSETKKSSQKAIKDYEKETGYKLTDKEKKDYIKSQLDESVKYLNSKEGKKGVNDAVKEAKKANPVKGGTFKAKDLTMSDYNQMQNAIRLGQKYGNKALGDDLAKKIGSNIAYHANKNKRSQFVHQFLQGSSYGDVESSIGKYGENERKALQESKESLAGMGGYMAGFMANMALGGTNSFGKAIAGSGAKAAAKGAAKSAGKKFAMNRAGELAAESPMNIVDAAKMAKDENGKIDKKKLAGYLGLNTVMTVGMGGAVEGLGMKWTKKQASEYMELAARQKAGTLTKEQGQRFQKLQAKLARKADDIQAASSNYADEAISTGRKTVEDNRALKNFVRHDQRYREAQKRLVAAKKAGGDVDAYKKEVEAAYSDATKRFRDEMQVRETNALTPSEQKSYFALKAQDRKGTITPTNKARLDYLDNRVKTAKKLIDDSANDVINRAGKDGAKFDRATLEGTVRHFENTGETAKLKKAQKLLADDIKAATKRSEDVTKAIEVMNKKTGISYRLASSDEIVELTGGRASKDDIINGFVRTNPETGKPEIVINKESPQAAQTIIGHETAHIIKDTSEDEFIELGKRLRKYSKELGELDELEAAMKKNYPELDLDTPEGRAAFDEELTSELLGRHIFGENNDFIMRLAGEKPSIARRIVEYVKNLMRRTDNPELVAQMKEMTDEVERLVGKIDADNIHGYNKPAEVINDGRRVTDEATGGRIAPEGRSQGHVFGGDNAHSIGRKRNENDGVAYRTSKRVSKENDTKGNANKPWDVSRIVDKNGKVTKEADDAYTRAVESGDMKTAQECVDNLAKVRFPDTVVKYKNGKLKRQFHGTDNGEFYVFRTNTEAGAHFGTKTVAKQKGERIYEVYLDLKNPVVFDKDLGSWDAGHRLTDELFYMKILSPEEYNSLLKANTNINLQEILKRKGYDGIEYPNWYEGSGESTSYIVFGQNQIKSAEPVTRTKDGIIPLSQRFDKSERDYRFSKAKKPADAGSFNGDAKPSAAETRITSKYDDAIKAIDSGKVDDKILRDIEVTRHEGNWVDNDGVVLTGKEVEDRIAEFRDLELKTQRRIDSDPRYATFRELDDLDSEINDLFEKNYTDNGLPKDVEARMDELAEKAQKLRDDIGSNIETKRAEVLREIRNDIWEESRAGGEVPGRVEKADIDKAIDDIEANRLSDDEVVKNNADIIADSDDAMSGMERPTPDSGQTPKGLKPNKKVSRPTKNDVESILKGTDANEEGAQRTFTKAEKKDIDESVERISNMIAHGDDAGARKEAEDLVEKYYNYDEFEKIEDPDYKEKRRELRAAQDYIRRQPWLMPEGSARNLDEFFESIGFPREKSRQFPIRRYPHADSVSGLKGVSGRMVMRGGRSPIGVDTRWDDMADNFPELFPAHIDGETARLQRMAEIALRDPMEIKEFYPQHYNADQIKELKQMVVDDILNLSRKNAGAYKSPDDVRPLRPIDGLDEDQLVKRINGEKRHLEAAKKAYGEDSPRVKEIEDYIAKAEKKLDGMRGETKEAPAPKEPAKPTSENIDATKAKGFDNLLNSKDDLIKETEAEKLERNVKETKDELEKAIKEHGEDSPRAKELKGKMDDLEARLEDAKHEKETGQKTNNTGDPRREEPSADLTIDEPRTRFGKAWNSLYRVSIDSFADIEKAAKKIGGKMGQDLLAQVNAVRNSKNIAGAWITDRRSNWQRETVGKSLDKIFKQAKGAKRQDFIDYCYHKHNLERLQVDKPISGMPQEAEESIKAIADLEKKYGDSIKTFQQDVVEYADDLLQYKVDAGLVSKAEAEKLRRYKNYIPTFTEGDFKAVLSDDASAGIKVERGIQRAVGGNEEDKLVDLYQQLAQSTRSTMKHCEMNEMIRMLSDLQGIRYSEVDKSISPDDMLQGSLFTEKSNGKHYATFYDPDGAHTIDIPEDIFKGIQEWSGEEKLAIMKLLKPFNAPGQVFKNLVTGWNVIFGARNGVRDMFTALTYTKDLMGFATSYPKALQTVLTRKGPYWDAYIAAGGKYSSLAKSGGVDSFLNALDSKAYSPLTWAKEINDTIETMPRMMEFISTIKKSGGIEGAGREVIDRAMRNANDVTLNFGRSGIYGRALNSGFVPYLNPSLQGLDKLVRVFTEAKQEKNMRGLLGLGMKMSTFAIAPAVFNEWMLRDNEDYQQLNTRDKDSNYFIPIGDGKFIKIPKARELVVAAEPAQYFFRHAQFGDSGGWKQMFQSAVDNIGVVNPLTDNLVSPLIRVASNKTWFGGDIESAYEVDNLLPQDRYDEATSLIAIDLAQKAPAKALKLSPKKIDNIIDSYTGIIGDIFLPMNAKASKGNLFVNKFVTDSVFSNKLSTEAWDSYETLKQKSNSNTLPGNESQNARYKMQDLYNKYLGDTVTLSNAISDIQNNDKLSKAEKQDLVRELKKSQNEIYRASKDGSVAKLDGKEVDPLKAIYNLYSKRKDTKGKAVGIAFKYAHKNYQEGYERYKESDEYNKLSAAEKGKQRVKYLNLVSSIRDTRGKIGEEKDKFIDYKTVAVVGRMKNSSESMVDSLGGSKGIYKYLKENAKTYKDYKYSLNHFIETEKTVVDSSRKIGLDYRSQMQNHDVAMSLAHKERDDGSYFIGDKKPEYQKTRMDPARYLVKKDRKQWSTKRIHDFADKHGFNYESDYDDVYKQVKKTYNDKSEKEWAAVTQVITGKGDNDFGDMSRKDDSGIMDTVKEGGRGGRRGRRGRRRGRRGRGGGGGGSGGGDNMPKTAAGNIKASITPTSIKEKGRATKQSASRQSVSRVHVSDPFSGRGSNLTKKSNLDDAYRKRLKKLSSRKH